MAFWPTQDPVRERHVPLHASNTATQNREAIQTAINSATAGDAIVLPPGTWEVDRSPDTTKAVRYCLYFDKSSVTLRGSGMDITTLKVPDSQTTFIGSDFLWVDVCTNSTFEDFTIDGNRVGRGVDDLNIGEDEGFNAKTSSFLTIRQVEVKNMGMDGFDLGDGGNCSDILIENCVARDNGGLGIHASAGGGVARMRVTNTVVSNNSIVRDTGDVGGLDHQGTGVMISHCRFTDNHHVAVALRGSAGIVVGNNVITGSPIGVWFRAGAGGCVTGNHFLDNTVTVQLETNVGQTEISGNIMEFNQAVTSAVIAVKLNGSLTSHISGNVIDVSNVGVDVVTSSADTAQRWHIVNNIFRRMATAIRVKAPRGSIVGNTMTRGKGHQIVIDGSGVNDVDIIGNVVDHTDASFKAIRLVNSPTNCRAVHNILDGGSELTGTGHVVQGAAVTGATVQDALTSLLSVLASQGVITDSHTYT